MGSPPQVRGKLRHLKPCDIVQGITPAGAGKTAAVLWVHGLSGDHPRRCGENPNSRRVRVQQSGSPPQVRGKLSKKTFLLSRIEDHPRRCGENFLSDRCRRSQKGSPPQVRGKHFFARHPQPPARITPAGAGKTAPGMRSGRPGWDHPRRCGENSPCLRIQRPETGSPPQVRGKPPEIYCVLPKVGITPAGAGKTPCGLDRTNIAQDHPRRCGENLIVDI